MSALQRKKKILMLGHLPPPYFGPSVTYQALLHSEFGRHYEVTFMDLTVVKSIGDLEKFHPRKVLKFLGFFGRELRLLLCGSYDLFCAPVSVNPQAFLKDAVLFGLARLFRVPTLLYAHGNNLPDFYCRSSRVVSRLIDRTFRNAAGVVVLGETLRFNFHWWLPPERILVVPTGLEPTEQLPPSRDDNNVTIVFLSNLAREKGFFVLLEAASRVVPKRPNTRFRFAGTWRQDVDRRDVAEFMARHGLEGHVEFIGTVQGESKREFFASADILAFPTYYYLETMGLVLLEAMQAGIPVVTTSRPSIPEIIRDGENGLIVREQDPDDLAEKLLRLIDDPEMRHRMGEANRKRFADYYTHEHYGRRMIDACERAIQLGRLSR